MKYNEEACLDFIRTAISGLMRKPPKKPTIHDKFYGYDLKDIESRIKTGLRGSAILKLYCEASDIDEMKLRKRILLANIPLYYRIKNKKEMYIVWSDSVGRWIID